MERVRNRRLPHVRGGVSDSCVPVTEEIESSPRAWGCFPLATGGRYAIVVFPTCVGVFLRGYLLDEEKLRLPHVRGGVSSLSQILVSYIGSSPRAWGCF